MLTSAEIKQTHDDVKPKINGLMADPENLINHLDDNTAALSHFAPDTATGLQGAMLRASQFLQSKLPQTPAKFALGPEHKPSSPDLKKWDKYFSTVTNPTSVLHHVAAGTVSPEHMEALQAVYPKMLNEMRLAVMDKLSSHISQKKNMPYKTKMALSLFLNQDLVPSLSPISMLANQNTLATATQAKEQQQMQQMNSTKSKNTSKLNKSESFLTSAQASAQRKDV